jgi:hypothetical protein
VSVNLIPLKILVNSIHSFKVIFLDLGMFMVEPKNLDHKTISKSGSSLKAF